MKGLSITNLSSMKRFADIYLSEIKKLEFLHQAGGEMIENPIFNTPYLILHGDIMSKLWSKFLILMKESLKII